MKHIHGRNWINTHACRLLQTAACASVHEKICLLLTFFYCLSVEFVIVWYVVLYWAHMKPSELKHTVYWYHTFACFAYALDRERGAKAERKDRDERREDEGEAELEGVKESVNLTVASWEKDEERNPGRVHWQITHVICDSGVIKEGLHEEENYLSLCARYWDKETLCNI